MVHKWLLWCQTFNLCSCDASHVENEIKTEIVPRDTNYYTIDNGQNSADRNGYYDKINSESILPNIQSPIATQIEIQCDHYIKDMLHKKIKEIIHQNGTKIEYPLCTVPTPYTVLHIDYKTVRISCCSFEENSIYQLPAIDSYFGDLCSIHNYKKINRYMINKRTSSPSIDIKDAATYMHHSIYKPLFDINNTLKSRYNQWDTIDLNKLDIFNKYINDESDLWLTLIAFSGFGAHRTKPFTASRQRDKSDNTMDIAYVNDVSFLSLYDVRDEYMKYGAIAYFDKNYCINKIYVSHYQKMITPNQYMHSKEEWEHAKWVWKVSISVATFVVDMLAHCRFREASGLIKAVQETLNPNHPIRRLLIPFTFGTVYANRVYNEYLKENGLFHRVFAFKYNALSLLIKDAMSDAPQKRERFDDMKYRWRFARKRVSLMKDCSEQIYPLYSHLLLFWNDTLKFVAEYMSLYYNDNDNDDSLLIDDEELIAFYGLLLKNSGIDGNFKLNKFNIINTLTQFICNSSIWNRHLCGSVSFEYSVDPAFVGLKIEKENPNSNTTQNYIEYVCTALSASWNLMHFKGYNVLQNAKKEIKWEKVLLNDNKKKKNGKIFDKYFNRKNYREKHPSMIPFIAANTECLATSIML